MNTGKAFDFILDYAEQSGGYVRFGQNNTTKDTDLSGYPLKKSPESEKYVVDGSVYCHSVEGYGPDMEAACVDYLTKAFDKIEDQLENLRSRLSELETSRNRILEAFPHLKCSVS